MSGSGKFCPRCGDTIEREEEISREGVDSALCDSCYIDEYDLVDAPNRVEVRVCSQCGAVYRGNRWVDVGAEDYTDIAIESVSEALSVHVDATSVSWQVAPEQVDTTTIRMHCQFSGVLRGTPISEEVVVPVKMGRETCERCGRIAGGSYASIVQVRANKRDPSDEECDRAGEIAHELVDELESKGDREAFVTQVTEVTGGLNIQLSTNRLGEQVARRIVREFGGTYSDYETLVTEDSDGNEVYRVTYAVHLPPFKPGEIIDPDNDGPVLVESVRGNLKGTRLTTGDHYEASYEDGNAPDADRLGLATDGEETTLVAVTDEHAVQVLHPSTYETKTVARPDYLDTDANTVTVIDTQKGLFVLPDGE
ncbi:60S ribosomal export protein NMD3 [Halovenus rubra]|uniref:60S ribosomal export protein NMD3 n=2 Tax=Halovenus rubra TaxID=869890 RepID=A0ABD5X8Q2_9EURY|nr:60S ribosomal export protein NMD3 [Halovenus rubra]